MREEFRDKNIFAYRIGPGEAVHEILAEPRKRLCAHGKTNRHNFSTVKHHTTMAGASRKRKAVVPSNSKSKRVCRGMLFPRLAIASNLTMQHRRGG